MRLPAELRLYTFLSIVLTSLGVIMLAPILRDQVHMSLTERFGGRAVGQSSFAPLGWISLGVIAFGLVGIHTAQRLSQEFRVNSEKNGHRYATAKRSPSNRSS